MKRVIAIGIILLFMLPVFTGLQFLNEGQNIDGSPPLQANIRNKTSVTRTQNENDLVAQWHFDEGNGLTLRDSSGNDNNGTLMNLKANNWVEGIRGTALKFDGETEYIDCGNEGGLNIDGSFTISAWVYSTSLKTIVAKWWDYFIDIHRIPG